MTSRRKSNQLITIIAGAALVSAAAAGVAQATTPPDSTPDTATAESAGASAMSIPETSAAPADSMASADSMAPGDSTPPGGSTAPGGAMESMTVTINLNPDAVWEDGSPIGVADFQCMLDATINTPGSLSTAGYELMTDISEGDSPQQIVVTFSEPYAAYKNMFQPLIKAAAYDDCNDISGDQLDFIGVSAQPYMMESWSLDQSILVPNPNYWGDAPLTDRIVMVPRDESSLLSGEADFIFPQGFAGLTDTLDSNPDISYTPGYGTNYEGLYFQELNGPFADPDFRAAFAHSIDRTTILSAIYEPIFPGGQLLNCGLWVPTIGPWCDDSIFGNEDGTDSYYDPAMAEQILTDAGWEKDGDGMWANGGEVPTIRWMVNAGNTRREDTQALMIPLFQEAGFNVVADNCDAACVFQQRLPALDYDLAMYINTAQPDPTVTAIMSCGAVPSAENNNQGQNSTGWCNEDASALMSESDQTLDETARSDLIHQVGQYLADDAVMLSLYQFPNVAAWNTTKVGGPVDADAANYTAFQNIDEWEDVDGDGQIVIGAEQWPECLNPVTECANSSWMVWTSTFKLFPTVWDTTSDGTYVPSELVTGEPEVVVGG